MPFLKSYASYLLLASLLFALTTAKDLQVDADLGAANDPVYPSLAEALEALLTNNNLTEATNTITLLDSCITVPQYFLGKKIGPAGASGGTIEIKYVPATSPAFTDASTCNGLPQVILLEDSYINLEYLTSFSISGINLLYGGSVNLNKISTVQTVTLSEMCFNNTEPDTDLPSGAYDYFHMEKITTFSMTNVVYLFDVRKKLLISEATQVTIDSIAIIVNGPPITTTTAEMLAAFNISNEESYATSVQITSASITCVPDATLGVNGFPSILWTSNTAAVEISTLAVTSCEFSYPATQLQSVISVINAPSFTTEGVTISFIQFNSYNKNFIYVSSVGTTVLSSFDISYFFANAGSSSSIFSHFVYISDDQAGSYYPMSVTLKEFTLTGCMAIQAKLVYVSFSSYENYGELLVQDFTISSHTAMFTSHLIYMVVQSPSEDSLATSNKYITLDRMTLSSNNLVSSTLNYFSLVNSTVNRATENLRLNINELETSQNVISYGTVFQVEGILTHIADSTMDGDSYNLNSYFYLSQQIVSTFLMKNTSVSNVAVQLASALVASNNTLTRNNVFESSFDDETATYAETRPFIIYNNSFTSVTTQMAYLFASNCPQIIIEKNSFTDVNLVFGGYIATLGNYIHFITSGGYYVNDTGSYSLISDYFSAFAAAEESIFTDYADMKAIYDNSKSLIASYDEFNNIFFILVQENIIDTVTASYSNTNNLFLITNFQISNGTIAAVNNQFSNFLVSQGGGVNIFMHTNMPLGTYMNNSLNGGYFPGYFFYFDSDSLLGIALKLNTLKNSSSGFSAIQAGTVCRNTIIADNFASDLEITGTFIDMNCYAIASSLVLQNLTFKNIYQAPNQGLLTTLNFLSIASKMEVTDEDEIPSILLEDFYFYNLTILNTQYYTQEVYQSSIVYMVTMVQDLQVKNITFDSLTASPRGSIIIATSPNVTISDSKFLNLGFGSTNGGFLVLLQNLTMRNCTFENNYGLNSKGAGLIKIINSDPANAILAINTQNSSFINNTAPYGTIIFSQDTSLQLTINDTRISNNQVTGSGGLIELMNITHSSILINNSNFTQTEGYSTTYPQLKILSLENSQTNVSLTLENANILARGSVYGVAIFIVGLEKVQINASQIKYFTESTVDNSNTLIPKFGFLQADNLEANITSFTATNISLDQTPLFTINCNMAAKSSYSWNLTLNESTFTDMALNEALFLITSDGDATATVPLDNLALLIENTTFKNITWTASSVSAAAGGVIRSSTILIGKTTPSSDFAIKVQNCTFSTLTGTTALVFGTVESMYDSVMLITTSKFTELNTTGSGAVLSLSTTPLTAFTSSFDGSVSRNASYKINSSSFTTIQGQSGCLVYWESTWRGISVTIEDTTTIKDIVCSQQGGVFYLKYSLTSTTLNQLAISGKLTEEHLVTINSTNTAYNTIEALSGGIVSFNGQNQLLRINFETNTIENVQVYQYGGVVQVVNSSFVASPTSPTSPSMTGMTRLLPSGDIRAVAEIIMTGNTIQSVSALNGGIIYEATLNKTTSIALDSNTFQSVIAALRGGAMHLMNPYLSIEYNAFREVYAVYSGNLIYSFVDEDILSYLNTTNTIFPTDLVLYTFAPTNLKIQLVSLTDGSALQLENEDVTPYNPIVPNLTSYSLSQYQLNIALAYIGGNGSQVVFDESPVIQLTLVFINPVDGSTQKYTSSNCTYSTCSVNANNIVLKGRAEDLVLVNATYESTMFTQFQQFYIRLRGCLPGEVNATNSYICTYCLQTTYSLTPTDTKCNDCPSGATCHGGAHISMNPGYYRSKDLEAKVRVVNCNDSGVRCLGGFNNSCDPVFMGPVCLQCNLDENYISAGKAATCNTCYSKPKLIGLATVLLLSSIAYQLLMIYTTYMEHKNEHSKYQTDKAMNKEIPNELKPGQFMVTFSTFCQITSILSSMDVGTVTSLLGISDTVGNSNTQVMFSLQCLYLTVAPDNFTGLQFQILVYTLSPLVKVSVAIIVEIIRGLIWRDKEGKGRRKALTRIGAVAVVLILLEQPGIVGLLCDYLSCTKLDPLVDEYYIQTNSNVECYTDKYNFFAKLFVIPALVFWAFVIPIAIFTILYKKRRELQDSEGLRIVFGNFYKSYAPRAYYWGVVILLFKITLYVLSSVLTTSEVFKGVIFMMIVHIYYYQLRRSAPYTNLRLILAEKCCCIAYMVMLTLVFLRVSTESDAIQVICAIFILISIAIAGAYLLANISILHISNVLNILKGLKDKMKEGKKQKEIVTETLNSLRLHHQQSRPETIAGRNKRRKAISIELPLR